MGESENTLQKWNDKLSKFLAKEKLVLLLTSAHLKGFWENARIINADFLAEGRYQLLFQTNEIKWTITYIVRSEEQYSVVLKNEYTEPMLAWSGGAYYKYMIYNKSFTHSDLEILQVLINENALKVIVTAAGEISKRKGTTN